MTAWRYLGEPPVPADGWVYALNWAETLGDTLVVHVLAGALELRPGDTLLRDETGELTVQAMPERAPRGRRRKDRTAV